MAQELTGRLKQACGGRAPEDDQTFLLARRV
jgi:hypothetical protein